MNRRVTLLLLGTLSIVACNRRASVGGPSPAGSTKATSALATIRPAVLASEQVDCDRVVADDKDVFWTTRSVEQRLAPSSTEQTGRVLSCAVTGCSLGPTLLAEGQSHVDALAIDASNVYWTQRGAHGIRSAIWKCSRTGCVSPQAIYHYGTGGGPAGLAVADAGVYWSDWEDRAIKRCPTDGCAGAPEVLARSAGHPQDLSVAQGIVYWTNDDGAILKCAAKGCDSHPTLLGSASKGPGAIAADDVRVVWINHRFGADIQGGHSSEILACPVGGCDGPPASLVKSDGSLSGITLRSGWLFWAERAGSSGSAIRKCQVDHCVPVTLASDVEAEHLAVSTAGIFWAEMRTHEIQRLMPQ